MISGFYKTYNVEKSLPSFFDIEKYVLHYENLQLFLSLRLKLKLKYIVYKNSITRNGSNQMLNLTQKKEQKQKKQKSIVQIMKQCCIQYNNGKVKKHN